MQAFGVDKHTRAFHGSKHRHKRHLNFGKNTRRALALKGILERLANRQGKRGGARRTSGDIVRGSLLSACGRKRNLQIAIGKIGVIKGIARGIEQVGGNDGVEQPRRIERQRVELLGFARIDRRKLVNEPLDIRRDHAAFTQQARKHACNQATGEIEPRNIFYGAAQLLLKAK